MISFSITPSSVISHHRQMLDATGMWAWILHRITGLGLVFYILLHTILMGVSLLSGKADFDATLSFVMTNPLFELLDILLLGAVIYHGLNGIRILLFDIGFGISTQSQKNIFWTFIGSGAVVWVGSIVLKLGR